MTNVQSHELNYDRYSMKQYDRDIVNSIPGHSEMHRAIEKLFSSAKNFAILELGVGTGITALHILKKAPHARYTAIDFSETMLDSARKKLHGYSVTFIADDYSKITLPKHNDLVVSVIGIHHQETDVDKKRLFRRIYNSLSEHGAFIFGDLMTYRDPAEAAVNEALHYHHLVEHAADEQSLREWAHHHKFLNKLAPMEDQIDWLKEIGFSVDVVFKKFNTVLLYARK